MAWLIVVLAFLACATTGAQARTAPDTFADLAEKLLPAVVNVSTTQGTESSQGIEIPELPPGSPFEEFFKEFMERNQSEQRRPRQRVTSLGSGFVISKDGYIVTNNHVIQNASSISVTFHDNSRLEARVVGHDPKTDIAILKVETSKDLPSVSFGDSDDVRVGDWVLAIGNPFGFGGTVTAGIISARGRDINAGPYDDFLQTDASINRGNSGGPMFNLDGKVIGINTAIFSPSGGSVGIGFAIPSASAEPVIQQLIEHGVVKRGWLGVRIQTVTKEIAENLGLDKVEGALVASVIKDSPAEKAEIETGDVILEFDGKHIEEMRRLPRLVAETEVNKTVPVKLWRRGETLTVRVTLGVLDEGEPELATSEAVQEKDPSSVSVSALGVSVATIDSAARQRFGLDEDARGVVVTDIDENAPAAEEGIEPGNIIIEVNQERVSSSGEVAAEVAKAVDEGRKSVLLLLDTEAGRRFVAVQLAKS